MKLVELYPEDSSVEFPATKLLLELSRPKPRKTVDKLIDAVHQSNEFVVPMLKLAAEGKWPPQVNADYIAWRSKEQAAIYVNQFKQAWLRHPRIFANLLAAGRPAE